MVLLVEDGSGVAGADSFGSLVDAAAYHVKWGNTAWTATGVTDALREVAMRKGARKIETDYGAYAYGSRVAQSQTFSWPKIEYASFAGKTMTPAAQISVLAEVQFEFALRALAGDIMPDLVDTGVVSQQSVSVGDISESTTYMGGKDPLPAYPLMDRMMRDLISGGGSIGQMVRA